MRIENTNGDRDTRGVVDEREEQILPDIAHGRLRKPACPDDAAEISLQQGDAGALHGNIGASAHRDSDFRCGEGGGIVDAVSGHGDDAACLMQLQDDGALLIRKDLRLNIGDPELPCDGVGCGPVVSG